MPEKRTKNYPKAGHEEFLRSKVIEMKDQLASNKENIELHVNRLSPNYAFPRQARGCFTARVTHFCVTAIVPASISYQQQSQVFQELPQRRSDSPVR